uniref:Uncharacterized protein n=1 Tax=Vitis vinifera TaxID=29760 RepID=F6I5A4_VITVI
MVNIIRYPTTQVFKSNELLFQNGILT